MNLLKVPYLIVCVTFLVLISSTKAQIPKNYKGRPFEDKYYHPGAQVIPGRVELAYFDLGGEGVAYHDVTPANEGSALNRTSGHERPGVSPYICFFRENEGVDISYTKDWADFNHPNKVDPKVNQLYIGWQENGEWTNYTIDIKAPGKYKIVTVYGNEDNHSSLWLNNQKLTDLVLPEKTGNWHYWNQATVGEVTFTKTGLNLLTLKYNKGANLAYLDFIKIDENEDTKTIANTSNMTKQTTKEQIEAIISKVETLIPEFQKKPDNSWADDNVAICIIDEQGNLYGKLYGSNKVKNRGTYKIAWTKASQVWITGLKTGEFEKKIFNGELKESDFGIQAPDFVGWTGGQPIVLKDGTKLSVGFSGFSGTNDLGIVQRAILELGI